MSIFSHKRTAATTMPPPRKPRSAVLPSQTHASLARGTGSRFGRMPVQALHVVGRGLDTCPGLYLGETLVRWLIPGRTCAPRWFMTLCIS